MTAALASVGADANVFAVPTATQSCQLLPYPANCRPILPTDILSCKQALAVRVYAVRVYIPLTTANTTAAAASEVGVAGSVSPNP